MNTTAKSIIGILGMVIVFMVYMAKNNANEIDKKLLEAEAALDESKELAEAQEDIANKNAAKAIERMNMVMEVKKELKACQDSK